MENLSEITSAFLTNKINCVDALNRAYDLGVSDNKIEKLIKELSILTKNFIFKDNGYYKIINEYSPSGLQKLSLCKIDDSFLKALNIAVVVVMKSKKKNKTL